MPSSESNSQALKESYAQADSAQVYLQTIEATFGGQFGGGFATNLDLVFVIDDTGSMSQEIATLVDIIADIVAAIDALFPSARYAVMRYKDEGAGQTYVAQDFTTNAEAVTTLLENITVTGGADGPENGFGATVMAVEDLNWSSTSQTARVAWLITDNTSHERGATEQEAIDAMAGLGAVFVLGSHGSDTYNYQDLIEATGGLQINIQGTNESIITAFGEALVLASDLISVDRVLLVDAQTDYNLALTDGGELELFTGHAFKITRPKQNDEGIASMNLVVDNTNQLVSKFIERAQGYNIPLYVRYRLYLPQDPSKPQNDPPLELVVSDVRISAFTVEASATNIDIVNMRFLTKRYVRSIFQGLGNI